MDLDIEGNSALVLASSSGLGKASAEALLEEGVDVVINGRDKEKLEEAVLDLERRGAGEIKGVVGDITKRKDIERLVENTVKYYDGMDHLVTCAGGPVSKSFTDTTDEDWYKNFDMLVMAVVWSVKGCLPYLKDGEGTIVNITSFSVKEAIPGLILSNSIRQSVIGLMKTISRELAPEVRSNAILPGYHRTERVDDLLEQRVIEGKISSKQEGEKEITEDIPLNRMGEPEELGKLVAFLSSPQSSYL